MHLEQNFLYADNPWDIIAKSETPKADDRKLDLLYQYSETYQQQYETYPSEEKRNLLIHFYDKLVDIAEICKGKVILHIDEDNNIGNLSYFGYELLQSGDDSDDLRFVLSDLFRTYEVISLFSHDDGFEIQIAAELYDKLLVQDNAEELEDIKKMMQRLNREDDEQADQD